MSEIDNLDKRYKNTQVFLETGEGIPTYKYKAFPHIRSVLGPIRTWINKSPEEFFGDDVYEEAKLSFKILCFTGSESFSTIKNRYRSLSKGSSKEGIAGWHPDLGGNSRAFAILNHAYRIFKEASE